MNIINKIKQKIFPFTHSIVLRNGKKLNCRSSLETTLYENENEKNILILDSSVNFKRKIITINKDDVLYYIEPFSLDNWDELIYKLYYSPKEKEGKSYIESIYG